MQKFLIGILSIVMASLAIVTTAQAAPFSVPTTAATLPPLGSTAGNMLTHKTHGWHRREEFGWYRGRRRWHRHWRPRRNCFRRNRVCRYRWGYGWRYRRCMRRAGC